MAHENYPVPSSPIQASQWPARFTASPPRGPQPSYFMGRANPFTTTKSVMHKTSGPNFKFHQFTNPLGISTDHGVYVPKRINNVSTPPHHTLKLTASSSSLGQLENEYVEYEERRDKELPFGCLHFAINPRFTERFRHLSKNFFALADCQNDYLKPPTACISSTTPFRYSLVFCIPHRWMKAIRLT